MDVADVNRDGRPDLVVVGTPAGRSTSSPATVTARSAPRPFWRRAAGRCRRQWAGSTTTSPSTWPSWTRSTTPCAST
ncbi:FG-GAP repeat protein [Micromonospora sp. BRA006-A]|nr:FG-GAP repeat protein [Micromonospora sp. BRA006-A]